MGSADWEALALADISSAAGLRKLASIADTRVFILTMASTMWLCETAATFVPRTAEVLRQMRIGLYPASDLGKDRIMAAFCEELNPRFILSIGDGPLESKAIEDLPRSQMRRSVQFVRGPTPRKLSAQWDFVRDQTASLLEPSSDNSEVFLCVERD
jgi:hypothetical protein